MKKRLTLSAVVGLAAVLPFVILEALNTRFPQGFPVALFGFLWLLTTAFVAVLTATVRRRESAVRLLLGIAVLGLLGWVWGALVVDQMPCLLGVPNCD